MPFLQFLPVGQALHLLPPQSVSLSSPFFLPSLQLGATQTPAVQMPLVQSLFTAHFLPFAQALHLPPQSTSVSLPFFCLSVQLAGGRSGAA